MAYDYRKLRGRIREVCGTETKFANQLGIIRVSLSKRLNCELEFSQDEIRRSCEILGIEPSCISSYFFKTKV